MESRLKSLFDFQRFEKNPRLDAMLAEAEARYAAVSDDDLEKYGAVSATVAAQMAKGVKEQLLTDIGVSVTGLAGPGGDEFGHEVGTVFIGFENQAKSIAKEYRFTGDREAVRRQTICAALELILEMM